MNFDSNGIRDIGMVMVSQYILTADRNNGRLSSIVCAVVSKSINTCYTSSLNTYLYK